MPFFAYQNDTLHAEQVSLVDIAQRFGTPTYVYSAAAIKQAYQGFADALAGMDHQIHYAVKANGNIGVLGLLAGLGSGFDIVSVGELERVITAGGDPAKVVFSGVGKRRDEIKRALEVGIACFNIESAAELERINQVAAELNTQAPISLRVNPDVDAHTHPYISTGLKTNKFGIAIEQAKALYEQAAQLDNVIIKGVDCHIGSQLTEVEPFIDAAKRVLTLIDELAAQDIHIQHIDLGGGLGIAYKDETPPSPKDYVQALKPLLAGRNLKLIIEPGRAMVGNAGVLLTTVELLKPDTAENQYNFAVVDAAMNDLLRPALYQAWHGIVPVKANSTAEKRAWSVVGPICETGDFLGQDRPLALAAGDLLAVQSAGAYGFTMASNYNARPRAAEVMVVDNQVHVVRERETIADLMRGEQILPMGSSLALKD